MYTFCLYQMFNNAYTHLQADFMSIQLSQAVSSACSAGGQSGALSCVVRHDIVARTVRNPWAVYPFATGVSTTNDTMTRDWITNNLLGVSEFSEDLAANMTSLVRSKFSINDRINRAWYINPGHKWPTVPGAPAQSVLLLSDRLIAIAVVSLRDGGGNIVRRRLMSTTYQSTHKKHNTRALLQDTSTITPTMVQVPRTTEEMVQAAMNSISNSPIAEAMPPISYGINVPNTLAKIVGVSEKPHDVIRVSMKALFPVDQTDNQVNIAIATRLRNNLARYCPTCDGVFPVFYGIKRKPASGTRRRNLLQFGLDSFDGDVDIVFSYMQGTANQVRIACFFCSLPSVQNKMQLRVLYAYRFCLQNFLGLFCQIHILQLLYSLEVVLKLSSITSRVVRSLPQQSQVPGMLRIQPMSSRISLHPPILHPLLPSLTTHLGLVWLLQRRLHQPRHPRKRIQLQWLSSG